MRCPATNGVAEPPCLLVDVKLPVQLVVPERQWGSDPRSSTHATCCKRSASDSDNTHVHGEADVVPGASAAVDGVEGMECGKSGTV